LIGGYVQLIRRNHRQRAPDRACDNPPIALLAALLTTLLLPLAALAADGAALVLDVTGDVRLASTADRINLSRYSKVYGGDRVVLAPGATLRLAYFRNGRQENHTGPGSLSVGEERSDVASSVRTDVSVIPVAVAQKIASVPELLALTRSSQSGGVVIRGTPKGAVPDDAAIDAARQTYARLRQSAAQDDVTPELFLYAVLHEQQRFDQLLDVVTEMQRRQPSNAEVRALADYAASKAASKLSR
jgi:hypothetical protein